MTKVKVTKIKSDIKQPKNQKRTLEALGLRKINSSNILEANPAILGMIQKVKHLVKVEEVTQDVQKKQVVKKEAPRTAEVIETAVKDAKVKAEPKTKKPAAKTTKAKSEKAPAKKVTKPKKEATE